MKSVAIVAAGLLVLAATSWATYVSECDDIAFPIDVDVENCEEEPCNFVRGTNVRMNMTFEAPHDLDALVPDALAKTGPLSIHYPLTEADGCKSLVSGQCPIQKGQKVVYHLEMPVLKEFPKVQLLLTFTMRDQNKEDVACFKMGATVVD